MIKEEKFFQVLKMKAFLRKRKVERNWTSNMTVQALIGEHLGVFLLNKRSFKSSQEFFVLRSADWSKESSVVCWTEFWSGTSTFWVQPEGRRARVPSGSSNCFFLQKEFDSKLYKFSGPVKAVPFYFFILIPKEILMNSPCSWRKPIVDLWFPQQWTCLSKLVRYW